MTNEEFQKAMLDKMGNIGKRLEKIEKDISSMKKDIKETKENVIYLKENQDKIKIAILEDINPEIAKIDSINKKLIRIDRAVTENKLNILDLKEAK